MSKRVRPWLAAVGAAGALAVLLPPVGSIARQYVFVQALQFAVLAVVVPALVALGVSWRGTRWHRPGRPDVTRPWAVLIGFIAVAVLWRLPVAVNALVRYPALTVAEAASLIVSGCALWLELVVLPTITGPLRAAFAALPMWAIWASAYIMAFSHTVWFTAFGGRAGHELGIAADQQIAAGLLFAMSGLCFAPVVFASWITWLQDA